MNIFYVVCCCCLLYVTVQSCDIPDCLEPDNNNSTECSCYMGCSEDTCCPGVKTMCTNALCYTDAKVLQCEPTCSGQFRQCTFSNDKHELCGPFNMSNYEMPCEGRKLRIQSEDVPYSWTDLTHLINYTNVQLELLMLTRVSDNNIYYIRWDIVRLMPNEYNDCGDMISEPIDIVNVLIKPTKRSERLGNHLFSYMAEKTKMFRKAYRLPIIMGSYECMGINIDKLSGMFSTGYISTDSYRKGELTILDVLKSRSSDAKYVIVDSLDLTEEHR